jgi:serine/threonine protein phosphatase 1
LAWSILNSQVSKARPCVPAGQRIYAIGDIHGQADLLSSLFMRIDEDLKARPNAKSVEVFIGDYIDRGPDSQQVIDLLIARRQAHHMIFLKGNHEDCALRFLNDPNVLPEWKNMGGLNTIASYGVTPISYGVTSARRDDPQSQHQLAAAFGRALPETHHKFFQGLTLAFTSGDFFFVHAGVRPRIPLQQQSKKDLLWIRNDFLLHEEDFGKVVVHGHTPTKEPDVRHNRINIDTGAYATGRLTCLVLEDDQMSFV